MKLKDLQLIIPAEVKIIDLAQPFTYETVDTFGGVFHRLENREVTMVYSKLNKTVISIK